MRRLLLSIVLSAATIVVAPSTAHAESGKVTCDSEYSQGSSGNQQTVTFTNCEPYQNAWPDVILKIATGLGGGILFILLFNSHFWESVPKRLRVNQVVEGPKTQNGGNARNGGAPTTTSPLS